MSRASFCFSIFLGLGLLPLSIPAQGVFQVQGQMIGLIDQRGVSRELGLSEDQVLKARQAATLAMTRMSETSKQVRALGLPRDQALKEVQKSRETTSARYRADLDAMLKPEQAKRLRQITFQMLKAGAFLDPDLQDELTMTAEQKVKLDEAMARRAEKMKQVSGLLKGDPRNQKAVFEAAMAVDRESLDDALSILTDAQKTRWQEMQGPPFTP